MYNITPRVSIEIEVIRCRVEISPPILISKLNLCAMNAAEEDKNKKKRKRIEAQRKRGVQSTRKCIIK